MKTIIFRVDASPLIGTGHFMRCLALGQALQDSGDKALFIMAGSLPTLETRLTDESITFINLPVIPASKEDADKTACIAKEQGALWIIVDGYQFDGEYQRKIKEAGINLLFIDDYGHSSHYFADIVLNQNIYATKKLYKQREPYTELLLGERYVFLRREFNKFRNYNRQNPKTAHKILITLGGTDPDNITAKVLDALEYIELANLEILVVLGAGYPYFPELNNIIKQSKYKIRIESNTTNISKFMAWADIAISSASTTAWELCFMGLPSLLVVLADNQKLVAKSLEKAKTSLNLGWYEDINKKKLAKTISKMLSSYEMRTQMSGQGKKLVDGRGLERIKFHLMSKIFELKSVEKEDSKLLYKWANDPVVRENSFNSENITWENHIDWLQSKLGNPSCLLYIVWLNGETPIGQIRFDIKGKEAKISMSIDKNFRGRGFSSPLIWMAAKKLFNQLTVEKINAYIKKANKRSYRSFEKAGFMWVKDIETQGQKAYHLVLKRENIG